MRCQGCGITATCETNNVVPPTAPRSGAVDGSLEDFLCTGQTSDSVFPGLPRREQSGLCCLCQIAGADCLGAFAGDTVAIQSGFNNQIECVRRESEFMLRDRQTASVSFHNYQTGCKSAGK